MMKKLLKHLFSSLAILTLVSCSKVELRTDVRFSENMVLVGAEKRINDDVSLKYPFRVRLVDSVLYVMDLHPATHYCHAFAYPSMKHLQSFAKRGAAPGELLDAENIRIDRQGHIWVLDANKKKIVEFTQRGEQIRQEIALDPALIRTLDIDLVDESTFVVPDYTGQHRLSFIDRQGRVVKNAFRIPVSEASSAPKPSVALAQAWRSFLHYHPENGILAMVTQLGQVMELYDLKQEKVVRVIRNENTEPQFVVRGNYAVPTGIMGYSDVHIGRQYIYALFWGHTFDAIKQGNHTEGGRYIHVFDLHGNPVTQFVLDRHITGFHVDEENGRMVGLDVNGHQPVVEYAFALNE